MKPEGLSDEQFDHFQQLASLFEQIAERKYTKGALEHKSKLWEYSDEWLEAAELDEIIDLVQYRLTRLLKRRFEDK